MEYFFAGDFSGIKSFIDHLLGLDNQSLYTQPDTPGFTLWVVGPNWKSESSKYGLLWQQKARFPRIIQLQTWYDARILTISTLMCHSWLLWHFIVFLKAKWFHLSTFSLKLTQKWRKCTLDNNFNFQVFFKLQV